MNSSTKKTAAVGGGASALVLALVFAIPTLPDLQTVLNANPLLAYTYNSLLNSSPVSISQGTITSNDYPNHIVVVNGKLVSESNSYTLTASDVGKIITVCGYSSDHAGCSRSIITN